MRVKGKRFLGILLSLVLVVGMLPAMSVTVHAEQETVPYLDADGTTKYCTEYTEVTRDPGITWDQTWYVIKGEVTIQGQEFFYTSANIILCDNAKLTFQDGFLVKQDCNLTIYAQSEGENMGALIAEANFAAIDTSSNLIINGGNIKATSKSFYGICSNGNTTINGGIVTASGGGTGGGISTKELTIKGGTVNFTSTTYDAIFAEDVAVSGGTVKANGERCGINASRNITITAGDVAAEANTDLGIYSFNDMTISGGTVKTTSNQGNAIYCDHGVITISGGSITATGAQQAIKGSIKNSITATGWTDTAGTKDLELIDVNTESHTFDSKYKKVQFPALAAKVTTPPKAKTLTFTGQAQELVDAGVAENGTMQYAVNKDATTPPTSGWTTSIPKETEAGTYYVWYYAKGITPDYDSAKDKIEVTIKEKDKPTQKKALEGDGQNISPGFPARFRFDVEYKAFIDRGAVYVDGNLVDPQHYDAEPGSTIITFKDEFIDSLSEGSHTVTVTLDDISVGLANFTVTKAKTPEDVLGAETEENQTPTTKEGAKSPSTGDSISTVLLLFLISFMGLAGIGLYTKKKELFK